MFLILVNSSRSSLRRSLSRRSSRDSEQKTPTPISKTKLIETEDSATGSVSFGVYLRYFKSVGIPFSITVFVFNALNQTMSVLSNGMLNFWCFLLSFNDSLYCYQFSLANQMVDRSKSS